MNNDINIIDEWPQWQEKARQFINDYGLKIIKVDINCWKLVQDRNLIFYNKDYYYNFSSGYGADNLIDVVARKLRDNNKFFVIKSIKKSFLFWKWDSNVFVELQKRPADYYFSNNDIEYLENL